MARAVRPALVLLAAVSVSALGLAACSGGDPDRDSTGVITASEEGADIFAIQVGDCAGDLTTGELTELDVVPCADPHVSEAFASSDLDEGGYPGTEAIDAQAEEDCTAAFETFIGLPYQESELFATWLTPTEESWEQGDREILCFVYDEDADTTGSLENAAR